LRFLVFFLTFLYAFDFVDVYRFQGEDTLSKKIETFLASPNFWKNKIKDYNVTFGYFQNQKNILVCVKDKKILDVYRYNKNLKLLDSIKVLTGLDGDKLKEGDLKTPIGVYKLVSLLTKVDSFYGPFAFESEYPNLYDRVQKKNGYGIWIHGFPLKGKRDDNTRGCIVMKNSNLEKLKEKINYKNSYLLIAQDRLLTTNIDEISKILAFIYKWRKAWRESDLKAYKTFYDKNFKKLDGKGLKEFLEYKKRVFKIRKHQKVEILFDDINIIPYQNINNEKIFRINMQQKYFAKNYKYIGPKELYIKFTNDKIKIIVEK